jgi:hypothetical protein
MHPPMPDSRSSFVTVISAGYSTKKRFAGMNIFETPTLCGKLPAVELKVSIPTLCNSSFPFSIVLPVSQR